MPKLGMIKPNLGTITTPPAAARATDSRLSLADALFSTTQQRVVGTLFGQPDRSFYVAELIALVGGGSGAVQRELMRLAQSELVTVQVSGKQKHYQANPRSPVFAELCAIVQKTMGLADPLRRALAPLADRILAAFVYGSVAKRQDTASSDIDLMLVSDEVTYSDFFAILEELTQRLGRAVNPTIYTRAELARRIKRHDSFITRVLGQPKIWLIGDAGAIGL
jgi:predicted nucleotidyltransferase